MAIASVVPFYFLGALFCSRLLVQHSDSVWPMPSQSFFLKLYLTQFIFTFDLCLNFGHFHRMTVHILNSVHTTNRSLFLPSSFLLKSNGINSGLTAFLSLWYKVLTSITIVLLLPLSFCFSHNWAFLWPITSVVLYSTPSFLPPWNIQLYLSGNVTIWVETCFRPKVFD